MFVQYISELWASSKTMSVCERQRFDQIRIGVLLGYRFKINAIIKCDYFNKSFNLADKLTAKMFSKIIMD